MKISKYPTGTVVNFKGYGKYEKLESGEWKSTEKVNTFFTNKYLKDMIKAGTLSFTVVSIPYRVVVELLSMLQEEYGDTDSEGKDVTYDSILKDAILRDRQSQEPIVRPGSWRDQINYAMADVRATENLFGSRVFHQTSAPTIGLKRYQI